MTTTRVYEGDLKQYDDPDWRPLLAAVGEELVGDFMWMHEVELADGTPVQAYKHIDTRRYVYLGEDGVAFVHEGPDRYRVVPRAAALGAVFAALHGLAGVSDAQVEGSWAAVERVSLE